MYAYQPVSKSQPNLADGNQAQPHNVIHNNLHHNHTKDNQWDKLGNFTFDDGASSGLSSGMKIWFAEWIGFYEVGKLH